MDTIILWPIFMMVVATHDPCMTRRALLPPTLSRREALALATASTLGAACAPVERAAASRKDRRAMITLRRAEERGHANHGWLDSHHTFSFAGYHDPAHMGFRALRVINDDRVAPGRGFGTHPHRDMEIISYVLDGALEHRDSMGTGSVIVPGDVQRMSAGRGVTHSEFNGSREAPVHFLQIWLQPAARGITPSYEQKTFATDVKRGRLRLVASPDGAEGSVTIHTDARLYATVLHRGESARLALASGRHAWVHVARGTVTVNGHPLRAGDAAALSDEREVTLEGDGEGEALLFDLA
jgi:quercetin 2,3-dioxygenase